MIELRREIFSSLLRGEAVAIEDLLASFGEVVIPMVEELVDGGVALLDEDRSYIVGAEGVSLQPTSHQLKIGGTDFYTWCAFDIIGIPAALKVDSIGVTHCPGCGKELIFDAKKGDFSGVSLQESIVGFWPNASGPVVENFCPSALIYCSIDHLKDHKGSKFDGQALPIKDLAERGEITWRIFAP